ncbi:MAG TPA: poly-beta-1,6-N-acetyl-D-glucosamine N-deacetylase PgaB [Terracidiphilus sp.]
MKRLLAVLCLLLSCAVASAGPPAQKVIVICYHDVRDDVGIGLPATAEHAQGPGITEPGIGSTADPDQYAVSTHNLVGHFDWLRSHGYHVITLQQMLDAHAGISTLPDKPVLLTFDDGLRSVYTKVFPLLKTYKYPAVVAVVGAWADLPVNGQVENGAHPLFREDFATWDQLREMQDSGLVEIASHTYDQHRGIPANPQGNMIPAVVTHRYRPATHDYESDDEYAERLRKDFARSSDEIREKLGVAPRAIVWPYGEYNRVSVSIAASVGMRVTFTLGTNPGGNVGDLDAVPRVLNLSNPSVADFSWEMQHLEPTGVIRAVQVDLDYVYDPDPAQQERNLSALLDRIKNLGATEVWLQAFADPEGEGSAESVYFPNHLLPVRADLFSRTAWQLHTRCGVKVFAWMPVLGWHLPDPAVHQRLEIHPQPGTDPEKPIRLNPFLPETRTLIAGLYEDMARNAPINGILFNDDAVLRDTDQLGPDAPPPGPERTRALIAFTRDLTAYVQRWRPDIKTARNLFAEPVLHPASENWYAESLPAFLAAYDEVALMAMPRMEEVKNPKEWLLKLAAKVASADGGLDRTVFELQTVDWRAGKGAIPTEDIVRQMRLLQDRGVRHLAYYPDDFVKDQPELKVMRPGFSAADSLPPQYGGGG